MDLRARSAKREALPSDPSAVSAYFAALERENPSHAPRFSSPWGSPQDVRELAPGVWLVSTARHGGMALSPSRMQFVPDCLRETPYSKGGWFEEDADVYIPMLVFADVRASFPGFDPALALRALEYLKGDSLSNIRKPREALEALARGL